MLHNYRFQRMCLRLSIVAIVCIQILFTPLTIFGLEHTYAQEADPVLSSPVTEPISTEPSPSTTETDIATPETTGPTSPPGPENSTYVYNSETGLWENDYYTWDPVTKQTAPKTQPEYSYNPETEHWDTTEWYYDPTSGNYQPNTVSAATDPTPEPINTDAAAESYEASAPVALFTSEDSNNGNLSDNSTAILENSNTGIFDLYYNADISHDIYLTSMSGDVYITGNTTAGNGTSGDSTGIANIINMLQSAWGIGGADIDLFNMDINGDVFGDFYIDPSQMFGALDSVDYVTNNNLDINVEATANMDNDIDIDALSGNVSGTSNTTVGNLSSGTANALANVVNMINSAITAGDSFIGNINIYGNFEGDILLPEESLQMLLASNEIPKATINTSQLVNNQAVVNMTNDHTITNDVDLTAESGDAILASNTTAGSATSGSANTNLTVLNLTGQQIVGSNALLVFVNVLGSWVGMLVNAPTGSTAAALGSGDTVYSSSVNNDLQADIENNFTIDNNIDLYAGSGDVTGSHNTSVGNATSGDATASANIANISNSGISLGGWFGLLFINVFGNWLGSFGVDTAAGNRPFVPPVEPGIAESLSPTTVTAFSFVPSSSPIATSIGSPMASQAVQEALEGNQKAKAILASARGNDDSGGPTALQAAFNWSSIVPVGLFALLAIGATEAAVYLFSKRKVSVA